MTVTTTTARVAYSGNGTTTTFTVPWYFLTAADLRVIKRSGSGLGTETLLSIGANYTVSGAGVGAGGSITLTIAPVSGESITIIRDPVIVQNTDYLTNDAFPAESHERALDLLTMSQQRLSERVDRALALADTDTLESGAYRAGNKRITGMAPGSLDSDAVTLLQVKALISTSGAIVGGGGVGTGVVVPDSEVARIIGLTVVDPSLTNLFAPLNSQYGTLASQILQLNNNVGSINTSIGLINVTTADMQSQIAALSAISGDPANIILLITNETDARQSGDNAIVQTMEKIGAAAGDNVSFLMNMDTVQIGPAETIGERFSGIATQFGAVNASIASEQTARTTADSALSQSLTKLGALNAGGTAFVFDLNTAYVGAAESLGQRLSGIATSLNNNTAAIFNEESARITQYGPLASSVTTLQTTVGTQASTISQQASTINGIRAKYAVKVDVNGNVSGYELISTGAVSNFKVLATSFQVYNGTTGVAPFEVSGGVVQIKNANIGTANIGTLNLAGSSVTNVQVFAQDYVGYTHSVSANTWVDLTNGVTGVALGILDIPSSGSPKISFRVYLNVARAGGSDQTCDFRVRRDDGTILTGLPSLRLTSNLQVFAWEFVDTAPIAGTNVYQVQVRGTTTGLLGAWYNSQMVATLLKR